MIPDYNAAESSDKPLYVRIDNDQLIISIGINTLASASEDNDDWHEWDSRIHQFVPLWKVVDNKGWAKDVVHEMLREGKDGSSPLTRFIDKMAGEALDQGSLSVWSPELGTDDPEDEDQ
jgi:hypothetical protein